MTIELIHVYKERDIFPSKIEASENIIFEDRPTGKSIVVDNDKKIALVGNVINSFYTLPGGGIEKNESVEAGIIRECYEEIGCDIELVHPVGIIEDYRNRDKKHCINYCYVARVVGKKGTPKLVGDEITNGMHVKWVSFEDAIQVLENEVAQVKKGEITFYNTAFNIFRDYSFLVKARGVIKKYYE